MILRLLEWEYKEKDDEWELSIEHIPCWLARRFGFKSWIATYVGDCTVWDLKLNDSYRDASTFVESALFQLWKIARRKQKITGLNKGSYEN